MNLNFVRLFDSASTEFLKCNAVQFFTPVSFYCRQPDYFDRTWTIRFRK